ncbi:CIH_HP2_G0044790.mRNA.1.CDS.1 [Saccharomyces cerevisiae]|nr:CIH_HP2_G0044790.mRNA.1.CDS.1 [Saccharomyces cerevisiae]CAI6676119.1 CIH_HP2_G0044790.mRNA.1.CDS.1 [Saccharomyces cerevisiae]
MKTKQPRNLICLILQTNPNEDQIKEKKEAKKIFKASQDARQKAKEEKERVAKEEEEKKLKEQQWRETDLNGWIKDKRLKLNKLIKRRKEKLKLRDEMKDRKSQVSQNRMKNLASLAEDNVKQGPNVIDTKRQ